MDDKEKQAKEYLDKFLGGEQNDNIGGGSIPPTYSDIIPESTAGFLNVPLEMLPCGIFYKNGTKIKIRAAKVWEVQSYSVVDSTNYLDITEKMNDMLSTCVKVIHSNGMNGSYKDLKDGDRIFLIFMIRELTFQEGNSLAKDVVCELCKTEFKIPFRATPGPNAPKTFVNYEMDETLKRFFDKDLKVFQFEIDGKVHRLAPPTIGLQEIFFKDIKSKVQEEKKPNVSFLKIIPYLLWDRSTITEEGIKSKEKDFKNLSMKEFQALNKSVDLMLFGVKELISVCPECGQEVRTDLTFPDGAANIFVDSDPFSNIL